MIFIQLIFILFGLIRAEFVQQEFSPLPESLVGSDCHSDDCDVFIGANGELTTLTGTERIEYPNGVTVYNFTVADNHNYYVIANLEAYENGASVVLVHNADASQYVDLTDFRKDHILNRHKAGSGKSGKTEFPASWSDGKILHEISDVATDVLPVQIGSWGGTFVEGIRDGVKIHVDFYPPNSVHAGRILTGYPIYD